VNISTVQKLIRFDMMVDNVLYRLYSWQ